MEISIAEYNVVIGICAGVVAILPFIEEFWPKTKSYKRKNLWKGSILFIAIGIGVWGTVAKDKKNELDTNKNGLNESNENLKNAYKVIDSIRGYVEKSKNILKENIDNLHALNGTIRDNIDRLLYITKKMNNTDEEQSDMAQESGELDFNFDTPISSDADITFKIGSNELKGGSIKGLNNTFITPSLKDGKFILNCKLYDSYNHLLLEIDSNDWWINPNSKEKLNWDDKGLELIDNKDKVIFSLDIQKNKTIVLHSILFSATDDYDKNGNEKFKKLFVYTGRHWIHKRAPI